MWEWELIKKGTVMFSYPPRNLFFSKP